MPESTLTIKCGYDYYPQLLNYYRYFLNLYEYEGAYFYYGSNIMFVDVFADGILFLASKENRFSVGITDQFTLNFYNRSFKLIYKYFKQTNVNQIFNNVVVNVIPLNWVSPEQTISLYAADKYTMLNTFVKVFSTGYKVTSFMTNIQDTEIYALGGPIQFNNLPFKNRPNGEALIKANTQATIKSPNLIEGVLIYPLNKNLKPTSLITIHPFTSGTNYSNPETFVTNTDDKFKSSFLNVVLNNNITDINDAYIQSSIDIDMIYYTQRALIGMNSLYNFPKNNLTTFKKYFTSSLNIGYYDYDTNQIINDSAYKYLIINCNANESEKYGITAYYPECLNYDNNFSFIFFSPVENTAKPIPYLKNAVCDGTIVTWNFFVLNIKQTPSVSQYFYLSNSAPHVNLVNTNMLTCKYPMNGPNINSQIIQNLQPSYCNISNDNSANKINVFYNFIFNTFKQSNIYNTFTLTNAADPDNYTWGINSLEAIDSLYNNFNKQIIATEISGINNCIFTTPEALLPYYYLNFETLINVTILSNTTLIDGNDGWLYSKEIFIPNQMFVPKLLGFNIISDDPNFYNYNVIQCNTQIRRNIEWYNYTFFTFEKNYFYMKKMINNPFKIRVLKNDVINFNVTLLIYVNF